MDSDISKTRFGGAGLLLVCPYDPSFERDLCVLTYSLVVVGELMNTAAYAFAPAVLVTPLGALSVLIG